MGYELTDVEIDRLNVAMYGCDSTAKDKEKYREWFATLPIVSREAAERAFRPLSDEEKRWFNDVFLACGRSGEESMRHAADQLLARRGEDLLGDGASDADDTDEIRMIRAASQLSGIVHRTKDPALARKLTVVREYLRRNPRFPWPFPTDEDAAPAEPMRTTVRDGDIGDPATWTPIGPEPSPSHDPVNHPAHYQGNGMEAIDVVKAFGLGFLDGNVVKYVLRQGKKNGVEDLKKARWYLDRMIVDRVTEAKP